MKRRAGTVDICGIPFRVYLADEKGEILMKDCYGCCHPEAQEIVINASSSREMRWLYLVHEMLHAIWAHAGAGDIVRGAKDADLEELMIRALSAPVVRAIASAERGVRL